MLFLRSDQLPHQQCGIRAASVAEHDLDGRFHLRHVGHGAQTDAERANQPYRRGAAAFLAPLWDAATRRPPLLLTLLLLLLLLVIVALRVMITVVLLVESSCRRLCHRQWVFCARAGHAQAFLCLCLRWHPGVRAPGAAVRLQHVESLAPRLQAFLDGTLATQRT